MRNNVKKCKKYSQNSKQHANPQGLENHARERRAPGYQEGINRNLGESPHQYNALGLSAGICKTNNSRCFDRVGDCSDHPR